MLHTDGEPNELYEFNEPNVAPTARRVIWFLFLSSDMYPWEMDVEGPYLCTYDSPMYTVEW